MSKEFVPLVGLMSCLIENDYLWLSKEKKKKRKKTSIVLQKNQKEKKLL